MAGAHRSLPVGSRARGLLAAGSTSAQSRTCALTALNAHIWNPQNGAERGGVRFGTGAQSIQMGSHIHPYTASRANHFLRKHIVPALGDHLVADVEYKDILAFHNSLHHMPTVANRAADILVTMFNLSDAWGWRASGTNLARGAPRFRVEKHERFLTREELYRLGEALRAAPAKRLASTHAAAAIRLLVLTGCRRNEILCLRWDDLNFDTGQMRLPDTKTGTRMAPLTPAVARVLNGVSRTPNNPWVFPGRKKGTRLVNLNDSRDRVRRHAQLDDVRLHDLRHYS